MRGTWLIAVLAAVAACGGGSGSATTSPTGPQSAALTEPSQTADAEFTAWADRFYRAHMEFRPHTAITLGHHEYDGRVPDRSAAAITAEIARLEKARSWLESAEPSTLSSAHQLDRQVLLAEIRRQLFDLAEIRRPNTQPIFYFLFDFSLSPYIDRNYAPLETRMTALLSACKAAPGYYQQMLANLDDQLSRPAVQVGIMMAQGTTQLVDKVLRGHAKQLGDSQLARDLDSCLTDLTATLGQAKGVLESKMAAASGDFAIGEERFLRMLSETEGFQTDLATLRAIGQADLDRNLAAIEAAARSIDKRKPIAKIIAEVSADKPEPDAVVAEAQAQVAQVLAFVRDHHIATVPDHSPVEVRPSPPHRRGNFALLSSAGPFETVPLPSFYYIAPPDPSWPAAQQRAYLPSKPDLLFITAHEVWPGHFLQNQLSHATGSRYLQSFETYSTSEGWAHYVEEMMWQQGLGKGDPRVHIGQLKNALLRNVRFMVAIGLHTGGMTVEEATRMFQDKAFADPQNARQQALRGTGDPMYLSYTLGKLAIMKLHQDWKEAQGDTYSLQRFHDTFLSYGEAPLPTIRQLMLGPSAGPAL